MALPTLFAVPQVSKRQQNRATLATTMFLCAYKRTHKGVGC